MVIVLILVNTDIGIMKEPVTLVMNLVILVTLPKIVILVTQLIYTMENVTTFVLEVILLKETFVMNVTPVITV